MAAWLYNSVLEVSKRNPSRYDTEALSYSTHDLAAFPALSYHITSAGAYFAACDAPRCLLCMVDVQIAGFVACSSSSISRAWVLVDATQGESLQHGAVLEQICTELATCS